MNEQFFKLPEEKQLRIINAALEVFSQNEYKRAVTDDIALKAGISKGLLFYYFHNKKSLYLFLFDYSTNKIKEQILDQHFSEIKDFFELLEYAAKSKVQILAKTPYLLDFVVRSFYSQKEEISEDLNILMQNATSSSFTDYFQNVDFSKFKDSVNPKEIYHMLIWMTDGYMHERRNKGLSIDLEEIMKKCKRWSTLLRQVSYKEEFLS